MPEYFRKPYNTLAVFVGPAPSSGYHFIGYTGNLNNNFEDSPANHNLLQEIERIQSCSYSINAKRNNVTQLGTRGTVSEPTVNPSEITVNLDYYQKGLINDLRIGLSANYAQFHGMLSGYAKYSGHTCILSGLNSREFRREMQDPFWPYDCREPRNLFMVVGNEYLDFHARNKVVEDFSGVDSRQGRDPNSTGYHVVSFGDCYLTRYRTQASVNSFAESSVSWTCNNVSVALSGSGVNIPAVNTQTRNQVTDNKFTIPSTIYEGGPYILHPGDIILDIARSGDNTPLNLGMDMRNVLINSYSIDIPLDRQDLESIGYKLPLDKPINFPTFANLDFSMVVPKVNSGSWINLLNQDSGYNISISLKSPAFPCVSNSGLANPHHSGPSISEQGVSIRYDFINAKFNSVGYNVDIGQNHLLATLSFSQEIDPDNLTRGLFVSGLLNVRKIEDYLLLEGVNSGFLLMEDGTPLVTNWSVLY